MKKSKPIMMYIPARLVEDLDQYLVDNPPAFKFERVYFYYVVNYLATRFYINKDSEFVNISLKNLEDATISNIASYAKLLRDGEFIIIENHSKNHRGSNAYKLNEKYLHGFVKTEILPNCKLFNKIRKRQRTKKAHYNRLEPFLKEMKSKFMQLDFDYSGAYNWVLENIELEKQYFHFVALSQLQDIRFRNFKRNRTNFRLDTNLTNLKSDLKQFIIGDFVSIDLTNCQPFLLSMLINNIITNHHIVYGGRFRLSDLVQSFGMKGLKKILKIHQNAKKHDLVNLSLFNNAVINGNLYEDFILHYPVKITRKEAKEIMFTVLFSRNEVHIKYRRFIPYEKQKAAFATVYPVVAEIVEILKEKDHAQLAINLQKLESYIFIDCIAKELVDNDIVPLTIHDSVIVESQHMEKTLEIIRNVFLENFNAIPSFHVEPLKHNRNEDN